MSSLSISSRHPCYHESDRGKVIPVIRQLKSSRVAQLNVIRWNEFLPLILLSIFYIVKEYLQYTLAHFIYGTKLTRPGQVIMQTDSSKCTDFAFLSEILIGRLNSFRPAASQLDFLEEQMNKHLNSHLSAFIQ